MIICRIAPHGFYFTVQNVEADIGNVEKNAQNNDFSPNFLVGIHDHIS